MPSDKKEDLRIQKTKEAIRNAFKDMLSEMKYEKISIKELALRARISRKTFYLHYSSLDELLVELQDDLIREFVERTKNMERPKDMDKITREFFMVSQELGKLGEQLICSGNYDYISRKITDSILGQTWKNVYKNPYFQNIIVSFISQGTLAIYKKWVADRKQIPLEDIIQLSIQLICNGINSLNPE